MGPAALSACRVVADAATTLTVHGRDSRISRVPVTKRFEADDSIMVSQFELSYVQDPVVQLQSGYVQQILNLLGRVIRTSFGSFSR